MVHALKPSIGRVDRVDRYRSIDRCGSVGAVGRVGSGRSGREPSASAIVRHTRASGMEPGTLALVAVLAAGVKVTIGGYLLAMGYVKCGGDANGGRSCLGFGRKDGDAGEEARARLTEEGAEESASGKPKEA